jgi:acyl carrier protein
MDLMTENRLIAEVAEAVRLAAKIPTNVLISAESRLIEDLAIDSLDLVGVLLDIQDHFDVVIDDDDVASLRTVADLAAYVAARRGTAAA